LSRGLFLYGCLVREGAFSWREGTPFLTGSPERERPPLLRSGSFFPFPLRRRSIIDFCGLFPFSFQPGQFWKSCIPGVFERTPLQKEKGGEFPLRGRDERRATPPPHSKHDPCVPRQPAIREQLTIFFFIMAKWIFPPLLP